MSGSGTAAASPLHILHCAETIKGGIASYLRDLLPLQRQQHGPGRIAVLIPASQRSELPLPDGVELLCFDDSGSRFVRSLRLAGLALRCARRRRAANVHIHSTFAGAALRPLLALGARDSRLVYCPHGWAWDRPMPAAARWATIAIERAWARLSHAVICISEHERRAALSHGLPADRLQLVHNGIAALAPPAGGRVPAWPPGRLRLLFIGRFDQQKGVDVLCDALRRLGPEAAALLAGGDVLGDGGARELPANARALGWVDAAQLQDALAGADALIVCSRWEGFGLVAAEAMRAGVAVVASRVGGLPELVDDGVSGLLVPPGDAAALAEALRGLQPEQLRRMGAAGRQRFERLFTIDRVHQRLETLYAG